MIWKMYHLRQFFQGDCENLDFMTQATKNNVDVICHSAAYAHEGLSSVSPTLICSNFRSTSVLQLDWNKLKELFLFINGKVWKY